MSQNLMVLLEQENELNESDSNGIAGTGERDGNAVLDNRMDSKEEEKDEGNDGVVLCETSAIRHSDQVYFPLSMLYLIALEKGKMVTMNDEVTEGGIWQYRHGEVCSCCWAVLKTAS